MTKPADEPPLRAGETETAEVILDINDEGARFVNQVQVQCGNAVRE